MEAKACAKHIRISPRKARQVVDLIRGKSVQEAYSILKFTPHKGSAIVTKVLKSAVANAENNFNMEKDNLYVSECYVCPGPIMKRIMPRDHGKAFRILKRTSHVTIVVKEKE